MRLVYRSTAYDHILVTADIAESEVVGQYRGQPFKFNYPRHVPVPQPILNLMYRGVSYRTTATGEVELAIPVLPVEQPAKAVAIQDHPITLTRKAIMSELSKIHRQNILRKLQHRMEVAKAKGDQTLIHQLEREMQQFA